MKPPTSQHANYPIEKNSGMNLKYIFDLKDEIDQQQKLGNFLSYEI